MTDIGLIVAAVVSVLAGLWYRQKSKIKKLEKELNLDEIQVKKDLSRLDMIEKKAQKRRENVKKSMDSYFNKYGEKLPSVFSDDGKSGDM